MGENEEVKKMIGTISVKIAAHNPSFPLEPIYTFTDSAQSFRIMNVPRRIGKWNIEKVFVNLSYPDNTTITKECVLNGSVWVGTVEGCAVSGTSQNGFVVTASGIDEDGNAVTNYVLGAGDLYVQQLDGTIAPTNSSRMYFYENVPDNPKKGEATFINGTLNIWDGTEWKPVAQSPDPSYIQDAEGDKINADRTVEIVEQGGQITHDELALKSELPTKTSDLTNDSGFITSSDIPTKTSELTNDSDFITSTQVEPYTDGGVDTGVAKWAYFLAMNNANKVDKSGAMYANLKTKSDLTPELYAYIEYETFWNFYLSQLFEQTYSPSVPLLFCKSTIRKKMGGRPRPYYDGYMWRTVGVGFAIPCSEDGIPDGRFVECNGISQTSQYISFDDDSMVHTITGNANWTAIETIDGQSGQITCTRTNQYKQQVYNERVANVSQLPTAVSQLTNDSGFITLAEVDTSKIDDQNGHRIKANLDYCNITLTATWTLSTPDDPNVQLNWDSTQNAWLGIEQYE